jgi:hypothetical protein
MSVILKASKIDYFIKPEHFGEKHSTVPDAIPGTSEIKGLLDSVMYQTLENYVYYISQWGDLTI